ncbi:MAG: hypothetical protein FD138_4558 [Planctomycetota bacterium]|nr:MAG: hypothetical protein FD138_4558 [Planctomycetota bacterium]
MQKRDVVHMLGEVRKQLADPMPALAVLMKLPTRFDDAALILLPTATERLHGDRLVVSSDHRRLVVERVDVARPAVHVEEDHALRRRIEVRLLRREWI